MIAEKTSLDKSILREKALLARAGLNIKQKKAAEKKAANNFLNYISLEKNQIIAVYYPINNEINCLGLVENLREKNYKICLPVVIKKDAPMVFRLWQKGDKLTPDLTKTLAPNTNATKINPDIIIMPLVAFDKNGARLGYGKGYYDRTIANMKNKPLLVGYAFSIQELDKIKQDVYDVPLDYIVSEDGVRKII